MVNHFGYEALEEYHGQIVRLIFRAHRCPLPALFWLHEEEARARIPGGLMRNRVLLDDDLIPVRRLAATTELLYRRGETKNVRL